MAVTTERRISPGAAASRAVVALGAALALVGGAWGSGRFGGTPVEETVDGALASDATLLAPAPEAFVIWPVVYAGLLVFAVVQALPGPGSSRRLRAASWPLLAAMVLNFAWIYSIQHDWLAASTAVLAGIVACLAWTAIVLVKSRTASLIEAVALDLPVGLYLGWSCVALVAGATATLSWWLGTDPAEGAAIAVGVTVGTAFLGIAMARDLATRPVLAWATSAALAWGLWWIAEARLQGTPADAAVGWTARVACWVVLATTLLTTIAAVIRAIREGRRRLASEDRTAD